ncbi:hypothetical protein B0H11DRAFT_1932083 [Mycena galericulata]|nr:hypothetical protein B0H11DRAFT_1932083 [Mycena galericulata]
MFCSAALFGNNNGASGTPARQPPKSHFMGSVECAQIEYCPMSIPVSVASLGSPFHYRPPLEKHEPYKRHYQARRRGSSGRTDPLEFMKSTTEFLRDLNHKRVLSDSAASVDVPEESSTFSFSSVEELATGLGHISLASGQTNSKVAPPAAVLSARDPDPSESQIPNPEESPFDVCPHGIRRVKPALGTFRSDTFSRPSNRHRSTFALTGLGGRRPEQNISLLIFILLISDFAYIATSSPVPQPHVSMHTAPALSPVSEDTCTIARWNGNFFGGDNTCTRLGSDLTVSTPA